jgi:hypothetical protein
MTAWRNNAGAFALSLLVDFQLVSNNVLCALINRGGPVEQGAPVKSNGSRDDTA